LEQCAGFKPQFGWALLKKAKTSTGDRLKFLSELERKVLWLTSWMIHNANHLRPNDDGLKVGGHQASSALLATIMTTLYFSILRPQDRVAVKPHASPAFHAIQYLLGNQTRNQLKSMTSALPRRQALLEASRGLQWQPRHRHADQRRSREGESPHQPDGGTGVMEGAHESPSGKALAARAVHSSGNRRSWDLNDRREPRRV
jgi:hypothetical protein